MKLFFFKFVSSVYLNTLTSTLELNLNLKNCIRFCERSEQNLMQSFEFKIDSNVGVKVFKYTLLVLSIKCKNARAEYSKSKCIR